MVKIEDLLLLGMFDIFGGQGNYPLARGLPVCYSPEIEGGYAIIEYPKEDYSFRNFERLPDKSILIPGLINYYIKDLESCIMSSAVWAGDLSLSDIPEIKMSLEKELFMKTTSNQFFWLSSPEQYKEGVKRVSFMKKEIVGLLGESLEEIFANVSFGSEIHNRGLLLWSSSEGKMEENKEIWKATVLKSYDHILIKYIKTGESKEEIDKLRQDVGHFCCFYSSQNPDLLLRTIIANDNPKLERISEIYHNGDQESLLKDLEQFKQKLVAEHS